MKIRHNTFAATVHHYHTIFHSSCQIFFEDLRLPPRAPPFELTSHGICIILHLCGRTSDPHCRFRIRHDARFRCPHSGGTRLHTTFEKIFRIFEDGLPQKSVFDLTSSPRTATVWETFYKLWQAVKKTAKKPM